MHGLPSIAELLLAIVLVTSPTWITGLGGVALLWRRNRWSWRYFALASPVIVAAGVLLHIVVVSA